MARFEQSRLGPASTTSYITQRDHGQAAAFTGGDIDQSSHIEITNHPERLRDAAGAADELLRLYPNTRQRDEIQAAAQDAREAADEGDDETRQSATSRLIAALTPLAAASTIVRFVVEWLGGALPG